MTERYLVVGLAKTGTTVISKTIQNSAGIRNYYLEPKTISFFESYAQTADDGVVKIIFDHWNDRRRLLNAIMHNELNDGFRGQHLHHARSPRRDDQPLELCGFSRIFRPDAETPGTPGIGSKLFRRKETEPDFSLRELIDILRDRFGVRITDASATVSRQYATYVGNLAPGRKTLIRYEDFLSSNLDDHPLKSLFAGSREVGADLQRTRRSGDSDDWKAFVTPADLDWLNDTLAHSIDALGYERDVEVGGTPDPENCSLYVERIIAEAQQLRSAPRD